MPPTRPEVSSRFRRDPRRPHVRTHRDVRERPVQDRRCDRARSRRGRVRHAGGARGREDDDARQSRDRKGPRRHALRQRRGDAPRGRGAQRDGPGRDRAAHVGRLLRGAGRDGHLMPLYLSRFSYTPETWAKLIANPEDRRKAAEEYIESVGGKLHGFWYAFGEHDGYNLWEAPDDVSMAAVALAIGGGGALSSLETTVPMSVDETMEALRRAGEVGYRPPGV